MTWHGKAEWKHVNYETLKEIIRTLSMFILHLNPKYFLWNLLVHSFLFSNNHIKIHLHVYSAVSLAGKVFRLQNPEYGGKLWREVSHPIGRFGTVTRSVLKVSAVYAKILSESTGHSDLCGCISYMSKEYFSSPNTQIHMVFLWMTLVILFFARNFRSLNAFFHQTW